MDETNILIVDDEQLIRDGMKIILEAHDGFQVVASASNGRDAFNRCGEFDIDVVLMDIRMPGSDGIEGTKLIKEKYPEIKILILTTFKDQAYIHQALQLGASGYLLKDSSPDAIYNGIRSVKSGNTVLHAEVSSILQGEQNKQERLEQVQMEYGLNDKEIEIIKLVAEGYSNKEIAISMYLSEGTIKNNVSSILTKLDLRDRTQLAIFAYKNHFAKE